MRRAILIGFQYNGDKKLPGISTDLYQVYSFLKINGWQEDEITILTDIEKDENTDVLKKSILEHIVDSEILSFIEDAKEKKQYIKFENHNHYNNFSSSFIKSKYYFIYYTGHSKNGNLILPGELYMSFDQFKDLLNAEKTICIMDCCECEIDLPFSIVDRSYKLQNVSFLENEILCIASSLQNQKSVTNKTGSLFTNYLFTLLRDPKLSVFTILEKLKKKINGEQTPNISSSFPSIYHIPGFVYSQPTISLTIHLNHLQVLISEA